MLQQAREGSLARASSLEDNEPAPPPKRKKKLVKAGDLQKAKAAAADEGKPIKEKASGELQKPKAGDDGKHSKDKASGPAPVKKHEGKKPSVGLKVKLKKAKAPE